MSRVALYLLILTLLTSSSLVWAVEKPACPSILMSLYESIKGDFTSKSDREEIARAFKTLPEKEAFKFSYEVFLRNRLKSIPQDQWPAVQKVLNKKTYKQTAIGSHFSPSEKNILIDIHPDHRETLIEYEQLAHEGEHAIQDFLMESKLGPIDRKEDYLRTRFTEELGAMTAEWQYLNSLPNEIRENWISKMHALKEQWERPGWNKNKFALWPGIVEIRMDPNKMIQKLQSAASSRAAYIRGQWALGRYSLDGFRNNHY